MYCGRDAPVRGTHASDYWESNNNIILGSKAVSLKLVERSTYISLPQKVLSLEVLLYIRSYSYTVVQ